MILMSWASSTRRQYHRFCQMFHQFLLSNTQFARAPFAEASVATFLLSLRGLHSSHVFAHALAALSALRAIYNMPPLLATFPRLRRLLMGLQRSSAAGVRRATSLSPAALHRILSQPVSSLRLLRDLAMIATGWFGGLRAGELTGLRRCQLRWSADPQAVSIVLFRSKTQQHSAPIWICLAGPHNHQWAASHWLAALLHHLPTWCPPPLHRPGECACPFLWNLPPFTNRPSTSWLSTIIRREVARIGLPANLFSGISLRSGAVSALAQADIEEKLRMDHCRWRNSEVASRYTREAVWRRMRPSQALESVLAAATVLTPIPPWDLGRLG